MAQVEHPLIVEIYNFVSDADGARYIVMEYVPCLLYTSRCV